MTNSMCGVRYLATLGLIALPLSRWLVIIIFVDSWAFMFGSGILVQGIGLSLSLQACTAGIFLCICLYAVSKLLIYLFLGTCLVLCPISDCPFAVAVRRYRMLFAPYRLPLPFG